MCVTLILTKWPSYFNLTFIHGDLFVKLRSADQKVQKFWLRNTENSVTWYVWPWFWPYDLDTQIWPGYGGDATKKVRRFKSYVSETPKFDICYVCDFDLDPITLILKFDLDMVVTYLLAQNKNNRSKGSKV